MSKHSKFVKIYTHTETVYYLDNEEIDRVVNDDTWLVDMTPAHLTAEEIEYYS